MSKSWVRLLFVGLVVMTTASHAATGDIAFQAEDKTIHLDTEGLTSTVDVMIHVETLASVSATGWGMIVSITPQSGATGTIQFSPPAIVNNQPNLDPASQNAYLDFDRDFNGMSYGTLGAMATDLQAVATYVEPVLGPAPTLDGDGNLSLPDGSGLVALPITASADAAGTFLISIDPDPIVTGVVFATGLAEPNDVAVHPVGSHVAGLLTVVNLVGDYNHNGAVEQADLDFVLLNWGDNTPPIPTGWINDFPDGPIDQAELDKVLLNWGNTASPSSQSVPEPGSFLLIVIGIVGNALRGVPYMGDHRRFRGWRMSTLPSASSQLLRS